MRCSFLKSFSQIQFTPKHHDSIKIWLAELVLPMPKILAINIVGRKNLKNEKLAGRGFCLKWRD
jgi:hypothetical protein